MSGMTCDVLQEVLILIIMEDTHGEKAHPALKLIYYVLILIIMEDTHGGL